MRKHITALLCVCLSIPLLAIPIDTLQISSLYEQAKAADDAEEYDKALAMALSALSEYEKAPDFVDSLLCDITDCVGRIHLSKGDLEEADAYFRKGLDLRKQVFGEGSVQVGKSYNNIALIHNEKSELDKAIETFEKVVDIYKEKLPPNHKSFGIVYANIAVVNVHLGKLEKGNQYFREVVRIDEMLFDSNSMELAIDYGNLGSSYNFLKQSEEARFFFKKALRIYESYPNEYFINKSILFNNIGASLQGDKKYNDAINAYEKSLQYRIKISGPKGPRLGYIYLGLANTYSKLNQHKLSIEMLQKALELRLLHFGQRNELVQVCYNYLGIEYSHLGDYEKAISYLNIGVENILKKKNLTVLPPNAERVLSMLLESRAKAKYEAYKKIGKSNHLSDAMVDIESSMVHLLNWRNSLDDIKSKALLNELHFSVYETAMEIYEEEGKINNSSSNIVKILSLMEKSKTSLLRDAINNTSAIRFSNIPDSLIQKEHELRDSVTKWKNDKSVSEQNIKQWKIDILDSLLLSANNEITNLHAYFKIHYPKYYDLKYNEEEVSFKALKGKLVDKTLIEYFLGDSSLFACVINKDTSAVLKLNKPRDFNAKVKAYQEAICGYIDPLSNKNELDSIYRFLAHEFYTILLKPLNQFLTKKLIIIPDGAIGHLSFETFLENLPTEFQDYRNYPFVLNAHQISYNFSTRMLLDIDTDQKSQNNILAVAPTFSTGNKIKLNAESVLSLSPLNYNETEIQLIAKLAQCKQLTETEATKDRFIKECSNYGILHLATHAKANQEMGEKSFLAFSSTADALDNEILYASEIYNLDIDSELVVLSACETGIGEVQKGEGIISLARAFFYSGVKSVVTTQWQISDFETMKIIESFYQNLLLETDKDKSLKMAKEVYISNSSPKNAHPFYWGAFIAIGNMDAVSIRTAKSESYRRYFLFGGIALIISIVFIRKRLKDRAKKNEN